MLTPETAREIVAHLRSTLTLPITPMRFKESASAQKWCKGQGIEIGPAAHNPFTFDPPTKKVIVDDEEDFIFFASHQIGLCGDASVPDYIAEADDLPLADSSFDFLLTSHVIEHLCNPMKAFAEWHRVVRNGGIIYTVCPHRDAHPPDASRKISDLTEIIRAYEENWTVDTCPVQEEHGGRRGHRFVYTLGSFMSMILHVNAGVLPDLKEPRQWLKLLAKEEIDSKVGNGFVTVYEVVK